MFNACPRCDWRPAPDAHWVCLCGHSWHIFDTDGVCPECGKVWDYAQCTPVDACGEWSDFEDWYHDHDSRTVEEFLADLRTGHLDSPSDNATTDSGDDLALSG